MNKTQILRKYHLLDQVAMHEETLVSWNIHQNKKIIHNITPKVCIIDPWWEKNIRIQVVMILHKCELWFYKEGVLAFLFDETLVLQP